MEVKVEVKMEVKIVIDGKPVGQPRPRFVRTATGVRTYSATHPANAYKRAIELLARQQFPTPLLGPVGVRILAVFPRLAKDKRPAEALHVAKTDCDNVAKAVLDGLNGVAFVDDAQVCDLAVTKRRAALNEKAHTEVTIWSL
jgi:Holliday junction resolvase RusA-like endonuclease